MNGKDFTLSGWFPWHTDAMTEWMDAEVEPGLTLRIRAAPAGIRTIAFLHEGAFPDVSHDAAPLAAEAARQLRAYFAGELREFDLPLDMEGTEFQKRVWRELLHIPYGETRSYIQIAEALGEPGGARAVGAANGANPIAIVVPCHRVIGSSGSLVGYGGGLPLKKRLLELEASQRPLAL